MTTIEYNDIKLDVPESWDDVTLGFYETFYKIRPTNARERVAFVAIVCGTESDILMSWPAEVFNVLVEHTMFLFKDHNIEPCAYMDVDNVKYFVPMEDKITLGAWVDAEEAQKAETKVLSNMLAIVCRPVGEEYNYENNETRAAMFASLPMTKVLGVMAFFLHCREMLKAHTEAYTKLREVADLLPRNIKSFLRLGGGIKLLRIWPVLKYYVLIRSLRYQLQKYSRFYST